MGCRAWYDAAPTRTANRPGIGPSRRLSLMSNRQPISTSLGVAAAARRASARSTSPRSPGTRPGRWSTTTRTPPDGPAARQSRRCPSWSRCGRRAQTTRALAHSLRTRCPTMAEYVQRCPLHGMMNAGGVAERLKAPVLKTGRPVRVSWVRIPPPPFKESHKP